MENDSAAPKMQSVQEETRQDVVIKFIATYWFMQLSNWRHSEWENIWG